MSHAQLHTENPQGRWNVCMDFKCTLNHQGIPDGWSLEGEWSMFSQLSVSLPSLMFSKSSVSVTVSTPWLTSPSCIVSDCGAGLCHSSLESASMGGDDGETESTEDERGCEETGDRYVDGKANVLGDDWVEMEGDSSSSVRRSSSSSEENEEWNSGGNTSGISGGVPG